MKAPAETARTAADWSRILTRLGYPLRAERRGRWITLPNGRVILGTFAEELEAAGFEIVTI